MSYALIEIILFLSLIKWMISNQLKMVSLPEKWQFWRYTTKKTTKKTTGLIRIVRNGLLKRVMPWFRPFFCPYQLNEWFRIIWRWYHYLTNASFHVIRWGRRQQRRQWMIQISLRWYQYLRNDSFDVIWWRRWQASVPLLEIGYWSELCLDLDHSFFGIN